VACDLLLLFEFSRTLRVATALIGGKAFVVDDDRCREPGPALRQSD
jgi:hypothetical protein